MHNSADSIKSSLKYIATQLDIRLSEYWSKKMDVTSDDHHVFSTIRGDVFAHLHGLSLSGGKRLRAALAYHGYLLTKKGKLDERMWNVMMAVELVHTALLIHDDFMDQDDMRRGRPTTHNHFAVGRSRHYGESMAVTIGDIVLCMGYELLNNCGFEPTLVQKAMSKMLTNIVDTAFGQAFDITIEMQDISQNMQNILKMHELKSSKYSFENPLHIGCILAETDESLCVILSEYARLVGGAFQITDDILGLFGDSNKTGKSDNSDLVHGKNTLLVAHVFQNGDADSISALKGAWGVVDATTSHIQKAKDAIVHSGSLEYSKNLALKLADEAMALIETIDRPELNSQSIEFLKGIASHIVKRES
jgi:geranylgeranyl diphosphate synthase, type I